MDGELHPFAHRVVFQTIQMVHVRLMAGKLDTTNVGFHLESDAYYVYKRRIKTEDKAKGRRCCLGEEIKHRMNSSLSSNHPGKKN